MPQVPAGNSIWELCNGAANMPCMTSDVRVQTARMQVGSGTVINQANLLPVQVDTVTDR